MPALGHRHRHRRPHPNGVACSVAARPLQLPRSRVVAHKPLAVGATARAVAWSLRYKSGPRCTTSGWPQSAAPWPTRTWPTTWRGAPATPAAATPRVRAVRRTPLDVEVPRGGRQPRPQHPRRVDEGQARR
ncbi:hypothetical protein Pelo_14280 [Pelomyxa schiedti]|nr:hypothetical protein Pelo_14280 [Pelomyxa schiedti]